jgi:hypothetical protein
MTAVPDISLKFQLEKHKDTTANANNSAVQNQTVNFFEVGKINCTSDAAETFCLPENLDVPVKKKTETLTRVPSLVSTPDNVRKFKDLFTKTLIEYFKNDIILLNNLLEISDKIVFKMEDLVLIIATLLDIETSKITITYEDIITSKCCGTVCKRLPLFMKITDIIVDNKQSFLISYNSFAIQLKNEYNVSLSYVVV